MRLPTYDELAKVPEQLDVLEHPLDQSLFVAGPPGSGKTVLALRRAQAVADYKKSNVTLVTYNRMLRRLIELVNEDGRVSPSTMHSFVGPHYRRLAGEDPGSSHDKNEFRWKAMLQCLEGRAPTEPHLVVDEAQDLPVGFFAYASRHIAGALTVFADEDQALGDRNATLEEIKQAAKLDDPILLHANHRNTPEIARLAEHFHSGRLPTAEVKRAATGELPRLVHWNRTDILSLVSNWIDTRGGSVGIVVHANETGHDLHRRLSEKLPQTRVDCYAHDRRNEGEINVLKDGVTVLNTKSVKGQEFDAVFILELERFMPCRNDVERRVMYMLCTRARDMLFLVHGPPLSVAAHDALPGPGILERDDGGRDHSDG